MSYNTHNTDIINTLIQQVLKNKTAVSTIYMPSPLLFKSPVFQCIKCSLIGCGLGNQAIAILRDAISRVNYISYHVTTLFRLFLLFEIEEQTPGWIFDDVYNAITNIVVSSNSGSSPPGLIDRINKCVNTLNYSDILYLESEQGNLSSSYLLNSLQHIKTSFFQSLENGVRSQYVQLTKR